ncbi:DnaD domain-containing protein [Bacillus kwashiorkori]|uniref:DnaD domain-containing protein n=1 Tax=Bacillus kwashiorkori TaxID=1522318 RepID=UPI0007859FF7|nr:DnaD domain-containing protein [Bacillus kwashiorkori]
MNKQILLELLEEGVVTIPSFLFKYYRKMQLTDIECMLLLHVHTFIQQGNHFPTIRQISERMSIDDVQLSQILQSLIQREFLQLMNGKSETGIVFEKYSLQPLWNKIVELLLIEAKEEESFQLKIEEGNLFSIFEQEFARPLSPIECETLSMWIDNDNHSPELIKAALREAVLSNKLNFRYIDRILFEWKKAGIKTVEQAAEQGKKYRMHQQKMKEEPKKKQTEAVPFYNWLES